MASGQVYQEGPVGVDFARASLWLKGLGLAAAVTDDARVSFQKHGCGRRGRHHLGLLFGATNEEQRPPTISTTDNPACESDDLRERACWTKHGCVYLRVSAGVAPVRAWCARVCGWPVL